MFFVSGGRHSARSMVSVPALEDFRCGGLFNLIWEAIPLMYYSRAEEVTPELMEAPLF